MLVASRSFSFSFVHQFLVRIVLDKLIIINTGECEEEEEKTRKERKNACRLSIGRLIHLFNETVVISISTPMLLRSTMR